MRQLAPPLLISALVMSLFGCAGSMDMPDSGPPAPDGGLPDSAPPAVDAGTPAISLWAGPAGMETEVTRIRYGDPVTVRVDGLVPGETVTIRAALWGYRSHIEVQADDDGRIDLSRDAPLSGTYEGVDREGLIWSMVRESDETERNFDVRFTVERDGSPIAETVLERTSLDDGLTVESFEEDGLVGVLFIPPGGPHPAVLTLGGSEGGIDTAAFNAAWFASRGYAALGLAYFGVDGLPAGLTDIPMEYFSLALERLRSQPAVDGDRIAVWGASRGGELALMLGARHPELSVVLAEVPSGVRWGSASDAGRAAWTAGMDVLPYLDAPDSSLPGVETLPSGEQGYRFTPIFEDGLRVASPGDLAAATIPIEESDATVLMIGGSDDGIWPSCELADIALQRLRDSGHAASHGDELLCLEDTGHFIGPPGWPTTEAYSYPDSRLGGQVVMGGTPQGTAHAQRAAYDRMLEVLAERL